MCLYSGPISSSRSGLQNAFNIGGEESCKCCSRAIILGCSTCKPASYKSDTGRGPRDCGKTKDCRLRKRTVWRSRHPTCSCSVRLRYGSRFWAKEGRTPNTTCWSGLQRCELSRLFGAGWGNWRLRGDWRESRCAKRYFGGDWPGRRIVSQVTCPTSIIDGWCGIVSNKLLLFEISFRSIADTDGVWRGIQAVEQRVWGGTKACPLAHLHFARGVLVFFFHENVFHRLFGTF